MILARIISAALLSALLGLSPNARADEDWPQINGGAHVTLCGRLQRIKVWGPPNFGEQPKTGGVYTLLVLSLQKPLEIPFAFETDGKVAEHILQLRLVGDQSQPAWRAVWGNSHPLIQVSGDIAHLGLWHEITQISLVPETITRVRQCPLEGH